MGRKLVVAGAVLFAVSCLHVREKYPEPAAAKRSCNTISMPFEARYEDGTLLAKRTLAEGDGSEQWEYFDRSGVRIVLLRVISPESRSFTAFYENGAKQLEGTYRVNHTDELPPNRHYGPGYMIQEDNLPQRPHGTWELYNEDGSLRARAVFSNGELLGGEEWDQQGAGATWSTKESAFEFRAARQVVPAELFYPGTEERRGIEADTCTLVCLDAAGKVVALFPLTQANTELEKAAANAIQRSKFKPSAVGSRALPTCQVSQYFFRIDS